ncbi:site-specific DNA-methyltransferase [Helicobacter pylori]|nr:site-specific DNA-methyltransferase [Helicobacter pylori]
MQNKEIGGEKSVNEKNVEVFNRYFPGCLSIENDDKLTLDTKKLKALLGDFSEIKEEGYGLDFVGKKIALNQAFKKNHKILKPLNESTSKHILIKGDNLDALKILKQSYSEKIKMIYIDPPYNTKNDSFIYGDDFSQSNEEVLKQLDYSKEKLDYIKNLFGSKCHSGWLSFMYPRLLLAKDLLKQDGVIFISIDDNECAQLKLLCDEIFGEGNFVAQFIWQTKKAAQGMTTQHMIVSNHESILIVCKSKEQFKFLGLDRDEDDFSNPDNDPRGLWKRQYLQRLDQGLPMRTITDPKTGNTYSFETPYTQDKLERWIKEERIIFPNSKDAYPARKEFLNEYENNKQLVTSLGLFPTKSITEQLYNLFDGVKIFTNPKPLDLIKFIIDQTTEKGDIILDFFAGSGTTAHAVLESNKSDYQKLSEGGGGYLMA